ncbi:GNAT family N-acetyltransferase [Phaeacidiphilus oryzae]|uniref:GNAT family N-acetyltransferase n=1 Tax=Phaeacidiphilus oryzae TaxID=348818 RepID=UPI00055A63FA|nr:GNAT family N-acetyltransferase [Phaeacidiphilus oryzae]
MDAFRTARLLLHPLSPDEAERLVAGVPGAGEEWAPGYPPEGDIRAASAFLRTCAEEGDPWPFGVYQIRLLGDGRAIGGIGFHGAPDAEGWVTVGYGLVPSARGNGFASEALRALLRFAREHGVSGVHGDTEPGNLPSQRVMTAAGMSPQPVGREPDGLLHYAVAWPVS